MSKKASTGFIIFVALIVIVLVFTAATGGKNQEPPGTEADLPMQITENSDELVGEIHDGHIHGPNGEIIPIEDKKTGKNEDS